MSRFYIKDDSEDVAIIGEHVYKAKPKDGCVPIIGEPVEIDKTGMEMFDWTKLLVIAICPGNRVVGYAYIDDGNNRATLPTITGCRV